MSREDLEALQLKRLKDLVKRVSESIPFYKESFAKAGLSADDITCLEDLAKFPFTTKQDMRNAYPFEMFAVPKSEVARIHCSSGTTGTATVVGYTQEIALLVSSMRQIVAKKLRFRSLMGMDCLQVGQVPIMVVSVRAVLCCLCRPVILNDR